MRWLLIVLFGCATTDPEPMKASRIFHSFISSQSLPWYLAWGDIPASSSYIVYDPLTATDIANSYINLANPGTNDASPVVAPSWSAGSGWSFDGSTQYINTGKPFLSTHTIVVWVEETYKTGNAYLLGSSQMSLLPFSNGNGTRVILATTTTLPDYSVSGILGIKVGAIYKNGVNRSTTGSHPGGTNYNIYIGCSNNAGTASFFGLGRVLRYAHYDFQLSDAQMTSLFDTMRNYQLPAVDSYSSKVLALSPIAYYPCNQAYGGFCLDHSGNNAHINPGLLGTTVGNSGLKGNSIKGATSPATYWEPAIGSPTAWAAATGCSLDEFSISCYFYSENANPQGRITELWPSANEYIAIEIRSGGLAIFHKENGVTWNTSPNVSLSNQTWSQVVITNSKSSGKACIYVNGVKTEFTRTGTGFVNPLPQSTVKFLETSTGRMQHIALFNYVLNQSQVDSLQ